MRKLNILILIIVLLSLQGCASMFKQPPLEADFGTPPVHYEETIKAHFDNVLIDPESARYQFSTPIKAYGNKGLVWGGGVSWQGWLVDVYVNAKNRYGGYTGRKLYAVAFKGEQIYRVIEGGEHTLLHRCADY